MSAGCCAGERWNEVKELCVTCPHAPAASGSVEQTLNDAYAEGRKDEAEENGAASRLIDAWVKAHGKPIPWEKAVEIVAIANKLPEAERAALLALGEE